MANDVELMVDQWIQTAWDRGASDIHFEPQKGEKLRVRARIDGELRTLETVPDGRRVTSCLKVKANLDVNERTLPQDGRIRFAESQGGKASLDLRVSTAPCMGGEKIVLRLIDNKRLGMTLEELGFSARMMASYKPLIESPHGLILHVGPTGSGKTTSLYAVIQTLNRGEVNIQTVEDPIEYDVPQITQTQVSHELGLTFPRVLRAMLRQDPDIILVGEIRDAETAEIGIEAAMTGHLVLSTLHTNDAVGTVVRLLDMGIQPWAIAYALRCVVSQRFVKKLCVQCRRSIQPAEHVAQLTGSRRPIFQAEGCKACFKTGYAGRTPIFEFLPNSPALRKAIYETATPDALQAVAARNGLISLWQAGLEKVFSGETSLEEVLAVAKGLRGIPKPPARASKPGAPGAAPARKPAAPPGAAGARPPAGKPAPRG